MEHPRASQSTPEHPGASQSIPEHPGASQPFLLFCPLLTLRGSSQPHRHSGGSGSTQGTCGAAATLCSSSSSRAGSQHLYQNRDPSQLTHIVISSPSQSDMSCWGGVSGEHRIPPSFTEAQSIASQCHCHAAAGLAFRSP